MLQIGWAVRNITPSRPVMLEGQIQRRIARTAMDPLTVTALALEGGDPADCAILISCDIAFVSEALQRAVRERLAHRLSDVPGEKVFLNATHTHTSMVLEGASYGEHAGGDVMSAPECAAWVADQAAEAAAQVWESRSPQTVGRAFEHAVVGHNRRAVYADGTAQMYGRTNRTDFTWIEGYEDHSLDLLFTWDAGGRLTGVVLDIPCPSQVDEALTEVTSADYWHDVRVALRARLGEGLHVLPLCGAAGDISPHFLLYGSQEEEMRRRRGVTERQEIAARVAAAVERGLACTKPFSGDTAFAHRVRRVELSPRKITHKERDWAEAEYQRARRKGNDDSWWLQSLRAVVESFDGLRAAAPVPVEVHVLRIGDAVLASSPFELFLDYGLRIKAQSPAAQTIVVQLAAGCEAYLPTDRAVQAGGYGAIPVASSVGPQGGQELVDATLQMIREVFPSPGQMPR
jgi:hypothetical protein